MKNIIFTIIILSVLSSCDDKTDSLISLNKEPIIQYFNNSLTDWKEINTIIIDSAKVYNSKNNSNYSIALRSKDANNNFENITINEKQIGGEFFLNNELFKIKKEVSLDSFSLAFRYFKKDIRSFSVKSLDDFGKFKEVFFKIHFIDNILPKANFEIRSANVLGVIEYSIDGSLSKDGDSNIGGYIVEYEYTIDNNIIRTPEKEIKHIFSKGSHQISLRVLDNDGAWSSQFSNTINID